MAPITVTINGNTIDPTAAQHVSAHARDSNFILVQAKHDLSIAEKQILEKEGVLIQEYVAQYTYLCRYEPYDLQKLRALDFIQTVNVAEEAEVVRYGAPLKTTSLLKDLVETDTEHTKYEVDLILHDTPNVVSAALAPYVAQTAGLNVGDLQILPHKIRCTVDQDKLPALAALDSINRIEQVRPKELFNDQARVILTLDTPKALALPEYQGSGQIVCVADTGFDQGVSIDTGDVRVHPAFADRIKDLSSIWPDTSAQDPMGHGTHVCASICGNGIYKDTAASKEVVMRGTAPSTKLIVQAMSKLTSDGDWELRTPADVRILFSDAYEKGAKIHSDSWGGSWDTNTGQADYEADATATDMFVCDYPDFVVLVAAGNNAQKDRTGTSQIGDIAAVKNGITVGATGTTRPNDGWKYIPGGTTRIGVTDTALFSSRGPTKSTRDSKGQTIVGRIKPDVVAPGVAILSAASRAVVSTARVRHMFGESPDPDWIFASGTSMSTPLVAGCVALLREALQQHGKQNPSAALIKALLVNGAVNSHPADPKQPVFDYQQGFGRVDVDTSITMIQQLTFVDGGNKQEKTAQDVAALRVDQAATNGNIWQSPALETPRGSSGHNRLAVTLTYPDPAGGLLQNDVNLIVRVGDQEQHGNMGAGNGFDSINNVEKIIWNDVPGSTATIIVRASAFTIPTAEQSFAVAWDFHSF